MTGTPEEKPGRQLNKMRIVIWTILILFLGIATVAAWMFHYSWKPGPSLAEPDAIVFIPRGTSTKEITSILADRGLIDEDIRFLILVRLMGRSARLQAGEFRLKTGQRPVQLIKELTSARPVEHVVTIPEGLNIEEIATIFSKGGWVDRQHFIDLAGDDGFIENLDLRGVQGLEGYLFPDTYRLIKPTRGADAIIRMLVARTLSVWHELEALNQSGLDRNQVFTLASIIEKESGVDEERPIIASVFLNRLKKKMRLQSDPTVIYGLPSFNGRLTRSDLKRSTPYNTYTIHGLPPGPICSPGKQSLQAVLYPSDSDYLYFVSKNDGTHYFSRSLKEHNRAVRKYQRRNE